MSGQEPFSIRYALEGKILNTVTFAKNGGVNMKITRAVGIVVAIILVVCAAAIAYWYQYAPKPPSEEKVTIKIAEPNWVHGRVIARMLKRVIEERLGYEVELVEVGSIGAIYAGVARGDIDVFTESHRPLYDSMYLPFEEKGELKTLAVNEIGRAMGIMVCPEAYEAGVRTIEDLRENGDKFRYEIIVGDPGWLATKKAFDFINDQGWTEWSVNVAGSETSQMAYLLKLRGEGQW